MNWPRFSQWQPNPNWNLRAVEQGKHPLDLKEGDALNVSMDGKVHQPVVVVTETSHDDELPSKAL